MCKEGLMNEVPTKAVTLNLSHVI